MDREERLERKLDKALEHIGSIDVTLAAQHESLKMHIHRTELLEKRMEVAEKQVNKAEGYIKGIGAIGLILAIIRYFSH